MDYRISRVRAFFGFGTGFDKKPAQIWKVGWLPMFLSLV